ncbi:MAG: hypothetical protein QN159_12235, partial [Armatimonadota bacterium]|nr:hypothetical protein [Armatimonadota bacterium]
DVRGTPAPTMTQDAQRSIEPTCPRAVLDRVFGGSVARLEDVPAGQRDTLASVVVDGRPVPAAQLTAINPLVEQAHYLCTWTELTGSLTAGQTSSNGQTVATGRTSTTAATTVGRARFDGRCPHFARVLYFTLRSGTTFSSACNSNDSCDTVLRDWAGQGVVRLPPTERPSFPQAPDGIFNLTWACQDPAVVFCDNYDNLLSGKRFFAESEGQSVFNPLRTEVKEAFRYKTQFQSRSGQSVGFAPVMCDASSRIVPYCYSPAAILDARDRVDCALALYDRHVAGTAPLSEAVATGLRDYLRESFGFAQIPNPLGDPRIEDGFERLNSELLVMLGDDAYTASFMSRFDLAGSRLSGFEGSRFEAGGLDLSGVAGYEMFKLYQAAQYFQMVLDRFFGQTPLLWRNLEQSDQSLRGFITNKTVTGYLTRVIRASTQLSNTWNEIARRYQALNRPDLARKVIERSYARAYMESQILAEFMRRIEETVPGNQQDQVAVAVQDAQRRYRVALLDMRNAHQRITDDVTVFGFARDYIPFPALAESDLNAFAVILERAKQRLAVAQEDELRALADNRSYETDAAAFQSELVQIRSTYEKQLGDLCGTFQGSDGRVYPAVPRYAHLDRTLSTLYDPCGFSSGDIWRKTGDLANLEIGLRRLRREVLNLKEQAQDLITKVQSQCDIVRRTADFQRAMQRRINGLQAHVDRMESASENLGRVLDFMNNASQLAQGTVDSNPFLIAGKVSVLTAYMIAGTAVLVSRAVLDIAINEVKDDIRDLEADRDYYVALAECEQFVAEGSYELRQIQREVLLKNLDVLIALNDIDTAVSDLTQLGNERLRLESEWEDANQLTINVEAARNDPNVRIYKNDAILNADRSFTAALREAYRATKVYEYYTSQSYAAQEKLFLTRMVTAGDYNLKQYLVELEDAFYDFGEQFGNPATRVAVLSLRDDVFQVPYYDEAARGGPRQLSQSERVARFRALIRSDRLVDNEGNIVVPFSTSFDQVSPLTNNHKILFIEAAIHGQDTGDDVARVYLRQVGSSAVRNARGERRYYAFPPRTAVLNPFFSGENRSGREAFDNFLGGPTASIFRDYRFRDRPFVHSNWEFVFNLRTEQVNKDVNLSSLDDVLLYVYYTDFVNL